LLAETLPAENPFDLNSFAESLLDEDKV